MPTWASILNNSQPPPPPEAPLVNANVLGAQVPVATGTCAPSTLAFTNGASGGGGGCELFRIDAQVGICRLPMKTGAGASGAGAVAMDAGCVARGACSVLMGAKTEASELIVDLSVK